MQKLNQKTKPKQIEATQIEGGGLWINHCGAGLIDKAFDKEHHQFGAGILIEGGGLNQLDAYKEQVHKSEITHLHLIMLKL